MALKLITPSAALVTLAEIKRHVRAADFCDDDDYLTSLVETAQRHIDGSEGWLGRAIGEQQWELRLDSFPCGHQYGERLYIPLPPLKSVDTVEYVDVDGQTQSISDFREFGVGSAIGRGFILPEYDTNWPETRCEPEAVRVTFTAGFASVPTQIKHAIMLIVGAWYENREDATSANLTEMPRGAEALLMPLRIWG